MSMRGIAHSDKHSPTITLILSISILFILSIPYVCHADTIDDLVPIIIQAESSGDPMANDGVSFGLMGISPCVLEDFNSAKVPNKGICTSQMVIRGERIHEGKLCYKHYFLKDLYIPEKNIEIGTWYLRKIQSWLPKEYKNSKAHIIASYNMGFFKFKKSGYKVPRSHKNKIYNKVYKEYWGAK